jgi:hypothetical protein
MKCIEYRHTQGVKTLKAVVQLPANGKYWNESKGLWQDELGDACKMRMVELSAANVYNSNIDEFDFLKLYKNKIEDGLYVTGSQFLSIAPGALYSVHIYDGETLISTTTRYEASSMRFLDMINEVQGRLGFPISKRLSEPNAKKIGMMMNDVITELLAAGRTTQDALTIYEALLPAEQTELYVSPVNCKSLNGLGTITIENSKLVQANGESITSFITNSRSIPTSYIISNKTNHSLTITFNSALQKEMYVRISVFERPAGLVFASDRTVYDSDLVIKGTEYIARDDFGMGGDVSGRELFMRYLTTDSNLNEDTNWSRISV